MGYSAAERRGDLMEISEKQLERETEEIWGDCCIPAVNFRALRQVLSRKKSCEKLQSGGRE